MASGATVDASRALAKISGIISRFDNKKFLKAVGQRELGWINKNFKDQGTEGRWAPLSKNTIAARRGSGTAQILRDTGRLSQSFTVEVKDPAVSIGTNNKVGIFHEEGTDPYIIRPKKRGGLLRFRTAGGFISARIVNHPGLPKRPMLPSKAVAQFIANDTIQKMIAVAVKGEKQPGL